ncbi:hypothetical protein D6C86_09428 [Aureobasidium pullulans]|uniref:NAD(P)-binding protein n=1 Tax=Aureobasidium pullulans TaxID=5580 RepID=A0A4S9UMA8_AURPU|nr:hypothetical protein D6C94_05232 [Aureobasidium pullulans]THZ39833.1 hypothetical protein D6C87_06848 [Aureobasidium pullulans]THZ54475.1 hypothetical protein D6C86_09428 [Aureobasidium pullulans]
MSRVCLITGGTQGIGQETAELLASSGWKVVISGRNSGKGRQVVEGIKANGGEATFIQADVSSQEAVKKLHQEAVSIYGRLDGAVNNAGISTDSSRMGDCSTEKFQDMINVNVFGLFWCMQEQIRVMLPQRNGHIVNLASIAGLHGIRYSSTYCATKHAVVALTRAAALDYALDGLKISAVAPGAIKTSILNQALESGAITEEAIAAIHPINKIGVPMDIARAISFLLDSPFVTGSILEVDGGVGAA